MTYTYTLYHNPNCSKSRAALEALKNLGIEPNIIHYLETPPGPKTLKHLLSILGISAHELLRTGEPLYKELNLAHDTLTEDQLIEIMSQYPKLIERPIFVAGNHAVIGRPLENILNLLDELN